MAAHRGDEERAQALLIEGLAEHRRRGNDWGAGFALRALGDVELAAGAWAGASAYFRESAALWRKSGYLEGIAAALAGLAVVAGETGQAARAARLFGAVEALRERFGSAMWPSERGTRERAVDRVRAELGDGEFSAAWATGRTLSVAEAIAEALAAETPGAGSSRPGHTLTPRELQVLRLVAAGQSDQQIAEALGIHRRTASNHVSTILHKLGVTTRRAAARRAVEAGLV